jgi:hypothetical protein
VEYWSQSYFCARFLYVRSTVKVFLWTQMMSVSYLFTLSRTFLNISWKNAWRFLNSRVKMLRNDSWYLTGIFQSFIDMCCDKKLLHQPELIRRKLWNLENVAESCLNLKFGAAFWSFKPAPISFFKQSWSWSLRPHISVRRVTILTLRLRAWRIQSNILTAGFWSWNIIIGYWPRVEICIQWAIGNIWMTIEKRN